MARPIWKGSISFGLVTIPVTLFSAENREEELHFNLLDSRNHAKIKYKKVNEATGEEVPWDQIIKGYEYEDGQYVFLGEEDFKRAAVEAGALGSSLSGSGPSLFALCRDEETAARVAHAMTSAVRTLIGGEPQTYVSRISGQGARILSTCAS